MKNVFKAKTALMLVMVAAILTGCGKSKNEGGVGTVYPGGFIPGGTSSGGCIAVTPGSAMNLSFQGNLYQGSGIRSDMTVYGSGLIVPSGSPYWRTTSYGDRTDMQINGSTAYAAVQISSSAIALIAQHGGYICGFEVNVSYYANAIQGQAWQGTLGGGTFALVAGNGYRVQM